MKIDFDLDLSAREVHKDGQVNIKLPKSDEIRFKMQKAKHDKKLNEWARKLILQLLDRLENQDEQDVA
jgi:hypothetical protein